MNKIQANQVQRQSNIELLRIFGMLLIVAHHYVVSSGIMSAFTFPQSIGEISANYLFLEFFGMWGKTGINIFIMISGYFMCKSNLTIKRYCKILFEFLFYNVGIYLVMLALGYEQFGLKRIAGMFFDVFTYANGSGNFICSFLIFYLFIPFLNMFISGVSKEQFKKFLLLLLFVFTGLSTFFYNTYIFGEVFWFITVYFMGAYLKMYPPVWANSFKASFIMLIISVILSYASVIGFLLLGIRRHTYMTTFFVSDANKLGAVLVSVFMFTTFKNIKIGYSRFINLVAKTTFGVLLIHSLSSVGRHILWVKILKVGRLAYKSLPGLMVYSIITVVVLFIVCSLIDMVRIFCVEKPVFDHFDPIEKLISKFWKKVCRIVKAVYDGLVRKVLG